MNVSLTFLPVILIGVGYLAPSRPSVASCPDRHAPCRSTLPE